MRCIPEVDEFQRQRSIGPMCKRVTGSLIPAKI